MLSDTPKTKSFIFNYQMIFLVFFLFILIFQREYINYVLLFWGITGLVLFILKKSKIFNLDEMIAKVDEQTTSFINKLCLSIGQLFLSTGLLVFSISFVRLFIVEPVIVPSESMLPTIQVGNVLYVNKLDNDNIQRGDIVVFNPPFLDNIKFVKRVIGVPNDTIEIIGQDITINGVKVEHQFIKDDVQTIQVNSNNGKPIENHTKLYKEIYKVHNNVPSYTVAINTEEQMLQHGNKLNFPDTKYFNAFDVCESKSTNHLVCHIPDGKYLVLGDNRNFSGDSRYWGLISHKHIVGKVTHKFPYSSILTN
jgi:signal peptidase I